MVAQNDQVYEAAVRYGQTFFSSFFKHEDEVVSVCVCVKQNSSQTLAEKIRWIRNVWRGREGGGERREGKEGYEQRWYVQSEECCKAFVVVSLYQKMVPRSQLKKKAMGEIKICKG